MWTDGEAPGPTSEVEWIEAPFAGDDPYERAATGPALGRAVLGALELALPVSPSKIIGVGRNYRAHATELGNEVPGDPLLFFKPPSCLLVSGGVVTLPRGFGRIDYEGELVVVIGRRASKVAAADAWRHVAGYALGDDVSSRELQQRDKQWTRAKGF
ncbi:MAG: fumarylacetoacetate hydrolase family protein, partial [Myxococcales bacterium]|nr:fumarylacetoacetate hydrolase family protein [Myxococcales bacterium]